MFIISPSIVPRARYWRRCSHLPTAQSGRWERRKEGKKEKNTQATGM